jgi:hypothetical protein
MNRATPGRSSTRQLEQLGALLDHCCRFLQPFRSAPAQAFYRWLLVVGFPIAAFGPILLSTQQLRNYNDFAGHAKFARLWYETGRLTTPHFLNSAMVIGAQRLVPDLSFAEAQWLVSLAMHVAVSVAVYVILKRAAPQFAQSHPNWLTLASVSLLLVGPITLLTVLNHNLYTGYFPPANVYHNPTILVLKPLALLSFWLIVCLLTKISLQPAGWMASLAAAALLIVLATLAKPNYTTCLLPALLVLVVADPRLRRSWRAWSAASAVAVAGIGVLAWQYSFTYGSDQQVDIRFSPFLLWPHLGNLPFLKFLFSIAFPLAVFAFVPGARGPVALRLGWWGFFFSCVFYYTFYEQWRALAFNFGWGCQIMLFLLFIFSLAFTLEWWQSADGGARHPGTAACFILYGMHLACGILFWLVYYNGLGDSRYM